MIRYLACALAALTLPACSTIDRGVMDHIRVDTVPQGAEASFTYIPFKASPRNPAAIRRVTCPETPCAIEIKRSQRGVVKVSMDGYDTAEYYVGPSRYRGGGGVDIEAMALKTTSTSLGVGLTGGLTYAAASQLGAAFANIFSFGLGNFQGVSSATGATAGTGVGLGIAAGSMLFDAGSGANKNTYPNPVTIGLAQTAEDPEDDPFVAAYYRLMRAYQQKQTICETRQKPAANEPNCTDLGRQYNAAKADLYALEDERDEDIKAMIKTAKDAAKEDTRDE